MRQSQLFTKTRKEAPKDEVSKSAQLLLRAGFVAKEMAGVYSMLPLGLRVQNKIVGIIRQAMDAIDGQEVSLTALQDPALWKATDRWDDRNVDNWFKTKLKNEAEAGLSFTHEEPLTRIMKQYIGSYRDLPKFVYQFQTKFRNELRVKSGLLRGREFLMKDLYSFTTNAAELDAYYDRAAAAYKKIYDAVGIGKLTHLTFASGGVFSKFSHEFQTLTAAGEDTIYVAKDKSLAINKEVFTEDVLRDLGRKKDDFEEAKSIEVGNIFKLGTRYSEALGLTYADESGKSHPVVMGCYGIGIGRLLATVVEIMADEKGIVWPAAIAPFDFHLVELNPTGNQTVKKTANELVQQLEQRGKEVLHDDRVDLSAGQKFADSDLIGIPTRIVVSEKTAAAGKLEIKDRSSGEVRYETAGKIG
ncbi:MAG: aminoacyl--tRNA ligase-related protein [Patescibacteria group bacterium]